MVQRVSDTHQLSIPQHILYRRHRHLSAGLLWRRLHLRRGEGLLRLAHLTTLHPTVLHRGNHRLEVSRPHPSSPT